MIGKNVVIAMLLSGLTLVVVLSGCGGDADEPSAEDLVGTWGTVVPDDETTQWIEVVFAADSSLLWKARVEGQEDGLTFNVDLAIQGTYAVSGSTLTLVHESADATVEFAFPLASIDVAREELDSLAKGLAAQTEEDAELEDWNGTWGLEGDILTLTNDDGAETVLTKK